MRDSNAKAAVDLANGYADFTISLLHATRADPRLKEFVDKVARSARDFRQWDDAAYTEMERKIGVQPTRLIGARAFTAEAAKIWQRNRIVYRLHPEMQTALQEMDTTTKVPCEVLRRLPHPNPFVILQNEVEVLPATVGPTVAVMPRMFGLFVIGARADGSYTNTDDPDVDTLVAAITVKLTYDGQRETMEELQLRVPLEGQHSPDEMLTHQKKLSRSIVGDRDDVKLAAFAFASNVLLYLCSDRPDVKPMRRVQRGKRAPVNKVIDLGFDVGAKLLAAKRIGQTSSTPVSEPTGRKLRPHIRRAHWQTFWTGPRTGKQVPVVKWIAATPVNVKEDQLLRTTVMEA